MKKITNLIIIDASSSMDNKTEEIRAGIKDILSEIKSDMKKNADEAKTKTIVCQFSNRGSFKVLLNTSKKSKIKKSIANDYKPNGMTALYDAIGQAFALVGKKQDGVFVSILTDGEENASQELNGDDVKKLFAEAKEKAWGLTFMGTTEGAINHATSLGISRSNTFQYADNERGADLSNKMKSTSRSLYYNSVMASASMSDIKTEGLTQVDEVTTPADVPTDVQSPKA